MARLKRHILTIDIYSSSLSIILTDNIKKTFNSYIKSKKLLSSPLSQDVQALFIKKDSGDYYMFLTHSFNDGDIVHEADHAAFQILKDHDIPLSSEEPHAYLIEFLFSKIKEVCTP